MAVNENYLYIVDRYDNSVTIFDKVTFQIINRVCKKGNGPGETIRPPKIIIKKNKLLLVAPLKTVEYTLEGEYINEKRNSIPSVSYAEALILTDQLAFPKYLTEESGSKEEFALYDSNTVKIKDIFIEDWTGVKRFETYLIWPENHYCQLDDRIYVSRPQKGFYLEIYNLEGDKIGTIFKNKQNIKPEKIHRTNQLDFLRDTLGVEVFNKFNRNNKLLKKPLPKVLPEIDKFWVTNKFVIVRTFKVNEMKYQYCIFDQNWNYLKDAYLPYTLYGKITFDDDFVYLIEENENEYILKKENYLK